MKAVVMAGGFGTRIQPLTNSIPKPMLPILNRPMMEYTIRKLKAVGINDIVVLLYFKPDVIKNYFRDGKKFGLNIKYILPNEDYGTAGAVKKAKKYLDETFIVVSGDLVTDFNFNEIINFHRLKKSKITITLTSVENPLQFGVVITNKEGKILRFLEKPAWSEVFSDTVNTGIYVMEPEILDYIPDNLPYDFSKDLFQKLMKMEIPIYGYIAKGYWRDVGNPESYRNVYKDIFDGKIKLKIEGKKLKFNKGYVYVEEECSIPEDIQIEGTVVLGKNVKIDEGVLLKDVCIGDNTEVKRGVYLENGVIWHDSRIDENCRFKNFVICNRVTVGKNSRAERGVIIAENVEVNENVVFENDVVVWPNKFIEVGSIVSSNIVWGDRWKHSIFEGGKVVGMTNIEISCEISAKLGEALGSIFPTGSYVCVSRDYHRASRMLKRAFLGGLLSTGINVVDLKLLPSPIMRFLLEKTEKVAGIHFRQSPNNPSYTEILFYDGDGVPIDTNTEKSIERYFFRENFRRVNYDKIGTIKESLNTLERYERKFLSLINKETLKSGKFRIVVNLLYGATSIIFPEIINRLNIENVILNAYFDEEKISSVPRLKDKALKETSKIVKVLNMDAGFLLYPNGQRLYIVSERGEIISPDKALLIFLYLIDKVVDRDIKVYLPVSAPTVLDNLLKNIIIERGKLTGIKANTLKEYYFVGNLEGNYIFTDLSFSPDGMFAIVRLLEMLAENKMSLSQVMENFPEYFFKHTIISCPSKLKGKIMRKFADEALNKTASFIDGVKIFADKKNWILMIPDQYSDNIHLFVQSESKEKLNEMFNEYLSKINNWLDR